MSFILVMLCAASGINVFLNLWILSLLDGSNKKQECAWTIKFVNGGLIVGEAEEQQEEREIKE